MGDWHKEHWQGLYRDPDTGFDLFFIWRPWRKGHLSRLIVNGGTFILSTSEIGSRMEAPFVYVILILILWFLEKQREMSRRGDAVENPRVYMTTQTLPSCTAELISLIMQSTWRKTFEPPIFINIVSSKLISDVPWTWIQFSIHHPPLLHDQSFLITATLNKLLAIPKFNPMTGLPTFYNTIGWIKDSSS